MLWNLVGVTDRWINQSDLQRFQGIDTQGLELMKQLMLIHGPSAKYNVVEIGENVVVCTSKVVI